MKSLGSLILLSILCILSFSCNDKNEEVFNNIFTDKGTLANIFTKGISNITGSSAIVYGSMNYTGNSFVSAYGVCWSKFADPTINSNSTIIGNKTGDFSYELTELEPGTVYYVKTFVINNAGTNYGEQKSFTTHNVPTITSNPINNFTATTAEVGGSIVSDNGENVTEKGIYFGLVSQPELTGTKLIIKRNSSNYDTTLTDLTIDKRYYVKAYAINNVGVSYGDEVSFLTEPQTVITDADGNSYNWVKIGSHIWLNENLKTTKYSDGSEIPNVTDNTIWDGLTTGAYCWMNNDVVNKNTYGALYNFYTIIDYRNICPNSWHVPSTGEWIDLIDSLGGSNIAGKYIIEGSFNGLFSGVRMVYYNFYPYNAAWWTNSYNYDDNAFHIWLWSDRYFVWPDISSMKAGYSIRCVRDK